MTQRPPLFAPRRGDRATADFASLPPQASARANGTAAATSAGFAVPDEASALPVPPAPDDRWRLNGSAWAIVRGGNAPSGIVTAGQLGGSQAGIRTFVSKSSFPVALTLLASAPLEQREGRFVAAGAALRSRAAGVIVERRIPLDRGSRPAVALTGYGGVYDVRVGKTLAFDGYVQGGVVGDIGFVDGAARLERVISSADRRRIGLGVGAWGGAQTGTARLDVGPQIAARLPVAGGTLRVAAEWRQRVAGRAEPGSGPSLSAGFDF